MMVRSRSCRSAVASMLALAAGLSVSTAALAQPGGFARRPSTVFQNARILTMSGKPIETGSIEIMGGSIGRIGKDIKIAENATTIDAKGLVITPGLIDVDGTLAVTFADRGSSDPQPTNRAFDAFDRYATTLFKDAVRNGVTSFYIAPRLGTGITGTGAVVRLQAGDGPNAGIVLKDQAALCIDLGSSLTPTQRLETLDRVRRQFKSAQDYREATETYKEELEDYEKKIKERAEKTAKDEKKDDSKDSETRKPDGGTPPTPGPNGSPGGGFRRPGGQGGPRPGNPAPDDKKEPATPPKSPSSDFAAAPPDAPPPQGQPAGGPKEDDIKKPSEPSPDRRSEVLLKALDREIPVRFRCHRSEDILNALELAKDFNLKVVIEGGTEAYLVAPQLAKAEASVVLGSSIARDYFQNDATRRRDASGIDALTRSGITWRVGSGRPLTTSPSEGSPTRFILANAQILTSRSSESTDALKLVTADAADFLDVSDKVGRLRPGLAADLVLWSGDPLDPSSRVQSVYINGELVYQAETPAGDKK